MSIVVREGDIESDVTSYTGTDIYILRYYVRIAWHKKDIIKSEGYFFENLLIYNVPFTGSGIIG